MAYKYLKDLTYKEIDEFLKHTSKYDEALFDRAIDMAYDYVSDYMLDAPKGIDYRYFGRGEYFRIEDMTKEVKDWFDDLKRDYDWLDDSTNEKIARAYELREIDTYDRDLTDEEYAEYESLIDEIEDEVFAKMKAEYNAAFDDEWHREIFMDYMEDFEPDYEDIYVDTDTWEIHNIEDGDDENYGIVDDDLSKQMTFL